MPKKMRPRGDTNVLAHRTRMLKPTQAEIQLCTDIEGHDLDKNIAIFY